MVYFYLQIPTLGCIISSDVSRPASGFDVIFILESVTPPFITLPFVIGFPAMDVSCFVNCTRWIFQSILSKHIRSI